MLAHFAVESRDFIKNLCRRRCRFFVAVVGILHRQIGRSGFDVLHVDRPRLRRIGKRRLQLDELAQVVVVERRGFAEAAAGVELVVPDAAGGGAFLEEQDDRFDARALERAAGAVEDRVQVAAR